MASLRELIAAHDRLDPRHKRALEWFLEREGAIIGWPEPLPGGVHLATRAKGIYKPQWSPYALSVRQTIEGPYPDHDVERLPDGSWQYKYFQEGLVVEAGRDNFTNRGLLECMKDTVPVAVLIQTAKSPIAKYRVQGLAFVDGWDEGYFNLRGLGSRDVAMQHFSLPAEATASPSQIADSLADAFDPRGMDDERRRVSKLISERRGQPGFRRLLLDAYGRKCAATGYDATASLEAAHIVPYRGPVTNHPSNGLLLRGDVHALFDMGMLAIHESEMRIILASDLRGTKYAPLHEALLAAPLPGYSSPSREALRTHRQWTGL